MLSQSQQTVAATPQATAFANLPLYFEPRIDPSLGSRPSTPDPFPEFLARTRSGIFLLRPAEAIITLSKTDPAWSGCREHASQEILQPHRQVRTVHWQFLGANPEAKICGWGELSAKINHFIGNDPVGWQTGVSTFRKVRVQELYPGIELIYYGNQRQLEYDFVIAPGADPARISFRITGADCVQISAEGDLVLQLGADQLRQHKPVIHQMIGGSHKEISGGYLLKNKETISFELGSYDPEYPLIIDPLLAYSTFIGGGKDDIGWDIALDANGNVYVAGETLSANIGTTSGAFQRTYGGGITNAGGDAFVAKFDNSGSLIYMTYLGGKGDDAALGIAVDSAGNAYVTGITDSTNFPTRSALKSSISGTLEPFFGLYPFDAFVTELNPTGSALIYSTYLGGDAQDQGIGIAVDQDGNAYVSGFTQSANFQLRNAFQKKLVGASDAFVTKIASNGTALVYSTYLGGSGDDHAEGVAVDSTGRAFITGYTTSTNFPVATNGFQPFPACCKDGFLAVLGPAGTNVASTYLGALGDEIGFRVAVDAAGHAYITGSQSGNGFPITPGNLNPGGVFKSTDAGSSWAPASAGLFHNVIYSLVLDPANPANLYAGTWRGVSASADGGASWQTIFQPVISPVLALTVDPASPSTLYTAISGVIYKFGFNGTNWAIIKASSIAQVINKLATSPQSPATVYAGTEGGVFRSVNAGTNWSAANSGLGNLQVRDLALDPLVSTTLFAATAGGVYRSTNSATNWTAFNHGLSNLLAQAIAIDPVSPSTVYVGTAGGLFKSLDAGSNWFSINSGLTSSNVTALAAPNVIYAGTTNGLFKSTDQGSSWIPATNGLSVLNITALAGNSSGAAYAGSRGRDAFGGTDAFLTKFIDTTNLEYSVVFGGNGTDQGWDVAVNPLSGDAYVAGSSSSTNFPTANTFGLLSATNRGATDAFVTAINSDASALLYSAYLGGRGNDFALGIEVDAAGNAYIAGQTDSSDFPTTNAFHAARSGDNDAFLARISLQAQPALNAVQLGNNVQLRWLAFQPEYQLESTPHLLASSLWTPVLQMPFLSNGWYCVTLPATNAQSFFRLKK